jgi:hypothetical protein
MQRVVATISFYCRLVAFLNCHNRWAYGPPDVLANVRHPILFSESEIDSAQRFTGGRTYFIE